MQYHQSCQTEGKLLFCGIIYVRVMMKLLTAPPVITHNSQNLQFILSFLVFVYHLLMPSSR